MVDNNSEIVRVIKVETEGSEMTVKQLREEISRLRDALLSVDNQSDEYKKILGQLIDDEKRLTDVMRAGKNEVHAAAGSYNALQNEMSALRKVWKEVTNEAERDEIGKKIKEINGQLKAMDSSIGNNQRKVGSYEEAINNAFGTNPRQRMRELRMELANLTVGTDAYNQKLKELAVLSHDQRELNEQLIYSSGDLGDVLKTFTGIAGGVASAFSAINGLMVLAGGATDDFQKSMQKMAALMAVVQGIQGVEGLFKKLSGLWQMFANLGKATEVVEKGMVAVSSAAGTAAGTSAALTAAEAGAAGATAKLGVETVKTTDKIIESTAAISPYAALLNKMQEAAARAGAMAHAEMHARNKLNREYKKGVVSQAEFIASNQRLLRSYMELFKVEMTILSTRKQLILGAISEAEAEAVLAKANETLAASAVQVTEAEIAEFKAHSKTMANVMAETAAKEKEIMANAELAASEKMLGNSVEDTAKKIDWSTFTLGNAWKQIKNVAKGIGSWIAKNPAAVIIALVAAITAETIALVKGIKQLKGEQELINKGWHEQASALAKMETQYQDNIDMLKAHGATAMEVYAAEANELKKLSDGYLDHYLTIAEIMGENDERTEASYEKWKELHDKYVEGLRDARTGLEEMLFTIEKTDRQKGMTELEKELDNINIQFQQAKVVAAHLFDEGIINAATYMEYLQRIREDLPLAIEQAKKKVTSGGGGKSTWQKEEEEIQKLLEKIKEANKTEIEKLTDKYKKEKALLEKHHKDTKALTEQYYKELDKLQQEAVDKAYEKNKKLYERSLKLLDPKTKLERAAKDTEDVMADFNDALSAGWSLNPGDNQSITAQMQEALKALHKYGVEGERDFAVAYKEAQKALEGAKAALEQFNANDANLALQNQRDLLAKGSKDWYVADAQLKAAQYNSLVKQMDETEAEFEARRMASEKAFKDAMANLAAYDTDEEQRRKDNNATATEIQFGDGTIEAMKARLEAARFYRDNLFQMQDETNEQFRTRQLAADKEVTEQEKAIWDAHVQYTIGIANSIGDLMNAVADYYMDSIERQKEADGEYNEESKKKFEQMKAMQIAIATIDMLAGITAAVSGLFTTKSGPWDIALAAAQAASIAVSGGLQIAKIKNTKLDSSSSSSSSSSSAFVTPAISPYQPNYVSNVTGQNEVTSLANALKETPLYVSVTDINNAQTKVTQRTNESKF